MRIARHVRKLEEYVPGEQPKAKSVVKLNTNENPYPPSPACAKVLAGFDLDRLRRYPDPNFSELRQALAKLNGTVPERIFVGNGSDEILALCAKAFVEDDEAIGSLDPSYSLYKTLAAIRNVKWVGVGEIVGSSNRRIVESSNVSLFLLTNPNAPTGEFREPAEIAKFAKGFRGIVLVDEAYADFARTNCMALATDAKNRNVLVMRTFSKSYSLAGLRVGYCVGPEDLIRALYKIKDSYNVDAVAQAVALAAVKDQAWMKANVAKVVAERARLTRELEKRGWDVIPSESNFVFARPPMKVDAIVPIASKQKKLSCSDAFETNASTRIGSRTPTFAETIFDELRKRNVFVRYFRGPKTGDRLRVTIGTHAQMNKLLNVLKTMGF